MPRKILIVDDMEINRKILSRMLGSDFIIMEASNGAEALETLRLACEDISAVLLDISMPGIDGFEVLRRIRQDKRLAHMPVIMITASEDEKTRVKSLALGANDFVMKPYSAEIIMHCLKNNIAFHEAAATVSALQRDKLTGLYTRESFFYNAALEIEKRPAGYFVLECVDIDGFKIINDQYGSETGDRVIRELATFLQESCDRFGGICGRVFADHFVSLYPGGLERTGLIGPGELEKRLLEATGIRLTFSVGRYIVEDKSLSVNAMFDRAAIARDTIKGRYDAHVAVFDESMRDKIVREQQIVNEMNGALASNQFEVWFQPQYNHSTDAMIGAEALVRWRHPQKGLVPPNEFITLFEQNGFIYSLDKFVWREVCRRLRRWIDEGRSPLPVSVNISRYDVFRPDIIDTITGFVEEYGLPRDLLRLEITESAFSESSQHIVEVIRELIDIGFTVEIDDFGSGYSSLNTLKDVPAQIIKLDMKFLESSSDSERGGNIVESVVRMAKWLDVTVIAEGVETREQADYLRSIGCNYMQGYLYARPMPLEQYEAHCNCSAREEHRPTLKTVGNLNNNAFWNPESMDTLIFNSYVGGACIFEYHLGRVELLRATEKYAQVIGSAGMTVEEALRLKWVEYMDAESLSRVTRYVEESIASKKEITGEFVFIDLPNCPHETYLRSTMRVIASTGDRYLVYCTNENITAQRQSERRALEAAEQMRMLMNDTPGGFARMRVFGDGTGRTEYVNDGYCEMFGTTRDEVVNAPRGDLMEGVHPDDFAELSARIARAIAGDGLVNAKFRLRAGKGEYVWTQIFARFVRDGGDLFVNCYYANLSASEKRELNLRETMPFILSAIMKSSQNLDFAKDKDFRYICCSPAFVRFTRQKTEADVIGKSDYDFWTKEEADHFRADDTRLFEGGESLVNFTEPIPSDDDVQHYSVTSKYILRDSAGEIVGLYGSGRDVTDTRAAFDRLQVLTDNIPGGIATYAVSPDSLKITYFNDGFCKMLGCTREEYEALSAKEGVLSLIDPAHLPALMAQRREITAHGTPVDSVFRCKRYDGKGELWINLRGAPGERHDETLFVNAVLFDVTAQREAEQEIKDAAAQIRGMMRDMPGGFTRLRLCDNGKFAPVYINDGMMSLTDLDADGLMDMYRRDICAGVHPDDVPAVQKFINDMLENGAARSARYRRLRGGGEYIWLSVLGRVTKDASGDTFLNLYYSDASEQVKKEEAQRTLLDNLPCGAGMYEFRDGRMNLTYQNKGYWDMVGLHEAAFPDNAPMSAIHPDDIPLVMRELTSAMEQGRDVVCEIRLRHLTLGYRSVHLVGRVVRGEADGFQIYATFMPNDRKTASYQYTLPLLLSAIMESSNDFVFAKDRDLRYICCSPAFLRLAGREDARDVVGRTDYELFPEDIAEQFRQNDRALIESGKPLVDFDETIAAVDGETHYCRSSKHILRDALGTVIGIYGVSRDVTKERGALEQLRLVNDSVPGGLVTFACKCGAIRIAYCNDGFCRLFGGTREGLMRRGDIDPVKWVFAEDRAALLEQIDALVRDGTPMDCVFRARAIDGGFKWIDEKAVATERRGDTVLFNAMLLDVTERQNALERLRISEEENALASRLGGNVIARYYIADKTLSIQPDAAAAYALPEIIHDVPEAPLRLGMISPESAEAYNTFFESIIRGKKVARAAFMQKYMGAWRWAEAESSTIFSDDGKPVKAVIVFRDITEKVEREVVYKRWRQSLRDRRPESYTLYRCNISSNSSFDTTEGALLHIEFAEGGFNFNDRTAEYVHKCVYEEDKERFFAFLNVDTLLADFYQGNRALSLDYRETRPDGVRWLRLSVDLVDSPYIADVDAYMLFEDIDEAKQLELQMKELSETDPLTGLLNRAAFIRCVNQALRASKPEPRCVLLMVDIDGFKQVNDVFGHAAGDQTLVDIADSLRAVVRRDDVVARLGGDEFVVFLENVSDSRAAAAKARQICALVRRAFSMEVRISASVGIAVAPRDGMDFDALYKNADSALYHVKGSGRDGFAFYDGEMADENLRPEPDAVAPDGEKRAEKKRRMLIVDDDVIDHALLRNIFHDEFIIEKAKNGNAALVRLHHYGSAISVVLLDLVMPGMDGFAVLEKMRESAELRAIPVIIVSGDESREACLRAVRMGATDFLTKPVDADLLRIRVHSAVSRAENERLRAKNSLLEVLNEERVRYEAMLDGAGITFAECDWRTGAFRYYPSITKYLRGTYDGRGLWQILLSDMVAETKTVRDMQRLAHSVAEDVTRAIASMQARLVTPDGTTHRFRVTIRKLVNEFRFTDRLIIALDDMDYEAE